MSHPSFLPSAGEGVWETFQTGVSGRGPFRVARAYWSYQSRRERWLCDSETKERLGFVKAVGGCTNVSWIGTYCGRSVSRSFGPTTLHKAQLDLRTFIDACPLDPVRIDGFDSQLERAGIDPCDPRNFATPYRDELANALEELTKETLALVRGLRRTLRKAPSTGTGTMASCMLQAADQAAKCRQLLLAAASQPLVHPVPLRLQALALWTNGLVKATRLSGLPARPFEARRFASEAELARLFGSAFVQARMSVDWPY